MAFSIFSKKGSEPPKLPTAAPAKPDAAAKPGSKPPAPSRSASPQPKPAALAPEAMSSKINEIEAEMDELDFTALTAQPIAPRPQPPSDLPGTVISTPPAAAHQAWLLLFDLLENLGEAEVFEAAAIDFAVAFETSPPAFHDRSSANDPALDTGGGQHYAINGPLDAAVAPQLARLAEIALHSKIMRIEFGKIQSVAGPGCTLLLAQLRAFNKARIDLVFSSIGHLAAVLGAAIETGRRTDPEVFWLLLLELQQFQGQQEVFEETALNYCITYEVSPPQWAAPAHLALGSVSQSAAVSAAVGAPLPQDALYLKGTLQSSADPRFAAINMYAESLRLVVIDTYDLRRVEPAAASELINVLSALYVKNKALELRSPSPLIATLLISMGFTEQARFTQRAA